MRLLQPHLDLEELRPGQILLPLLVRQLLLADNRVLAVRTFGIGGHVRSPLHETSRFDETFCLDGAKYLTRISSSSSREHYLSLREFR